VIWLPGCCPDTGKYGIVIEEAAYQNTVIGEAVPGMVDQSVG